MSKESQVCAQNISFCRSPPFTFFPIKLPCGNCLKYWRNSSWNSLQVQTTVLLWHCIRHRNSAHLYCIRQRNSALWYCIGGLQAENVLDPRAVHCACNLIARAPWEGLDGNQQELEGFWISDSDRTSTRSTRTPSTITTMITTTKSVFAVLLRTKMVWLRHWECFGVLLIYGNCPAKTLVCSICNALTKSFTISLSGFLPCTCQAKYYDSHTFLHQLDSISPGD